MPQFNLTCNSCEAVFKITSSDEPGFCPMCAEELVLDYSADLPDDDFIPDYTENDDDL